MFYTVCTKSNRHFELRMYKTNYLDERINQMSLSCFSILIHPERNKGRIGRLNFPGLTDLFLLEPTECVAYSTDSLRMLQPNGRYRRITHRRIYRRPFHSVLLVFLVVCLAFPFASFFSHTPVFIYLSFYIYIILIFYLNFLLLHIFPLIFIITSVCSFSPFYVGCWQNCKKWLLAS
jgi:lipopolysaccharide export LptBFGC system permease protein LptF